MRRIVTMGALGVAISAAGWAVAGTETDPSAAARAAVERAIPLIGKGAAGHARQRTCFSCHHQALPLFALTTARDHGFPVDAAALQAQVTFTEASLHGGIEAYRKGTGQLGAIGTASFALAALDAGGVKPDETTSAVTDYLLGKEGAGGQWRITSNRPPSEASDFTATYFAAHAVRAFSTPEQKGRVSERLEKARGWLLATEGKDTEDEVFRLRGLRETGAPDRAIQAASTQLRAGQRADGGWGQTAELASDAYATGSVLVALHEAAGMSTGDPAYRKGLAFLIGQQLSDGSWHVASRSKPVQSYYESGFPHGKDQFISMAASCWAVTALADGCGR